MKQKAKFFIVTTVSDSMLFFKGQLGGLKEEFNISLICTAGSYLDEMTKEYNVKSYEIKMEREISLLNDLISLVNLTKLFFKHKPNIVHGNTPKGSLLSMIAAWFTRVPVRIYYIHGLRYLGTSGRKRKLLIMMERLTCFFATDIIAVSEGAKEQFRIDKVTSKNIDVIWNGSVNGVDLNYFNPDNIETASIEGIKEGDFVFGFAGRIVKDKGINELMEAFGKLCDKYENVKLILLGTFENKEELDSYTLDQIENNKNIYHLGFQKDIRPYFKLMNIFVLPSYREGLCAVILEASAMKTPIIATNISGIKEVVEDRKTGRLIEARNSKELLDMMEYCLNNKKELEEMSTESRKFVQEKYEQKQVWQKSKEKYLQIIAEKNV